METYPVPEETLREVLLNAVAHKDYSSGAPIQTSVYDDKILFWNSGELHPGWTVETLTRKHSSQPFNPDVANAFFRAGMIESWGRGIEHIIAACKVARVPAPLIRYEANGLWVEFSLPKASQAGATHDPGEPSKASVKASVKTSVKILELLENKPEMTLAEVAGVIGKSVRAIELASSKLVKAGRLRHLGPQKGGRWEVRK